MGEKVQAYLDDDLYDEVLEEHEQTGKSKSEIVNEAVRSNYEPTGSSWFLQSFSQALFVVGFVLVATRAVSFAVGLGVSFIGLGLMLWFQIQEHASEPNTTLWEAFKRTLGV